MVSSIPHERIDLDSKNSDIETKVLNVVSQSLKQNWVKSDLPIKQLTDGLSNILFAVCSSENNGVIVKIYGENSDLIVNRQAEIRFMTHLAKYHLSPPILLTFNNGFIYQYVPGEPIAHGDEEKALLIARTLAELHSVPLIDEKQDGQLVEKLRHYINLLSGVNEELYKRIKLSASPFLNDIPWSKLNEDIDRIAEVFNGDKSKWKDLTVVTCHNDTQTLNFLINDKKNQKLSIIDFEHCARNIWLFDVFNYFVEYAGVESEEPDYENSYPSREKRKQWLEVYLSHATFFNKQMTTEELCDFGDQLRAPIHLYWALWSFLEALLNPASMQKFDYVKYGKCRLEQYEKHKEQFFSSV